MVNYVRIFAIIRIQLKLSKIQWKSEIFGFGKIFFALVFERKLSNCTMLAAFNRVFKVSFSTFLSFLTQLVYFENCEISVKIWNFSNYSHISSLLLISFARNWCEAQLRLCVNYLICLVCGVGNRQSVTRRDSRCPKNREGAARGPDHGARPPAEDSTCESYCSNW